MIAIGNMLWRIGDILDIDEQLAWTRDAGFHGVGLHASAGAQGKWSGVEPTVCDIKERERLRQKIGEFSFAEIHAPFGIELRHETLSSDTDSLTPILGLARDLGAGILTVHARISESRESKWVDFMYELNSAAIRMQTHIALEIVTGFDSVMSWDFSNIGVNLDVGHMYLPPNKPLLDNMGGIGDLIRRIGSALVHLHLHDVYNDTDHLEIGAGIVEFDEIATALRDIGYSKGAMLELNPDRVAPEGINRSAAYLMRCFDKAGIR